MELRLDKWRRSETVLPYLYLKSSGQLPYQPLAFDELGHSTSKSIDSFNMSFSMIGCLFGTSNLEKAVVSLNNF